MRGAMGACLLAVMAGPALAQGAGPVAPAPPVGVPGFAEPVKKPEPLIDSGAWVTAADYPSGALRRGEQGITYFSARVDTAGRVDACEITQSSGSAELDEATCRLVVARARFRPAQDARGNPTPAYYRTRIRWVIPHGTPPFPPFTTIVSFVLLPDGTVRDCKAEFPVQPPGVAPAKICEGLYFTKGYADADGKPVARRVIMTRKVEVLPVEQAVSDQASTGRKP